MLTLVNASYVRSCDCARCANKRTVAKWPSGAFSAGGYVRAVGHRRGRARMGYDVCPACFRAGRLPRLAVSPQPWPMASASG